MNWLKAAAKWEDEKKFQKRGKAQHEGNEPR